MLARLCLLALCATAAAELHAVLVAGSHEYLNYRHHADIAHAYQLLTRGGVKPENIITMMYDDVASDPANPFPGQLFNRPAATMEEANEVYASVKDHIDYKGDDVLPENFVAVLTGNASGTGGKRVLQTGPEDDVFIYFSDHGGPGFLGFPVFTHTGCCFWDHQLNDALDTMYEKKMYRQLVFYTEACHSGSMWENLPKDRNIYALSAASATEESFAVYCPGSPGKRSYVDGKDVGSCLGDIFSIHWLEGAEKMDLSAETLQAQFGKIAKQTASHSTVQQWGDLSIGGDMAGEFEGTGKTAATAAAADASVADDAVNSRDVPLVVKYHMYLNSPPAQRSERAAAFIAEVKHREATDATFAALAEKLALPVERDISTKRYARCHTPAQQAVVQHCGPYSDYSLRHAKVVTAACNHWQGDLAKVTAAVKSVCAGM